MTSARKFAFPGWRHVAATLLLCLSVSSTIAAVNPFVVRDMRVEGLQRISEGTVFNYLPINIGDTVDHIRISEAIRALYSQALFDDIEMRHDGDTLIIAVKERPSIESFEIEGNKDIKTEDLMESLRGVGLAKGRTFDRSTLDNVAMFLREQYYDRGKYGVKIDSNVEERPNNTVRIKIDVAEGDRAKIRQVNIVGNTSFDEDEIREGFTLDTGNWLSWIRQDDRYEKQGLEGDLETLRSFYMDRGFANFGIESTQVAISPNKKDIFVTITIKEGEKYTISDVKLVGEMVVPEAYLRNMVLAQPGSIFNLGLLTQSAEFMSMRLGEQGYANAEINPVPELDHENNTAEITFYVDPKSRVYVRRINFNGIDEVDDEVLRRELRQLEGAYLSNVLIDRSKFRLQRLPYVQPTVESGNSLAVWAIPSRKSCCSTAASCTRTFLVPAIVSHSSYPPGNFRSSPACRILIRTARWTASAERSALIFERSRSLHLPHLTSRRRRPAPLSITVIL
jgi:outer membrane protein insertion porin family